MSYLPYAQLTRTACALLLCTALSTPATSSETFNPSDAAAISHVLHENQAILPHVQLGYSASVDALPDGQNPYNLTHIHESLKKNYGQDLNFLNTIQQEFYTMLYPASLHTQDMGQSSEESRTFNAQLQNIYTKFMTQIYAEFGTYHTLSGTLSSESDQQIKFLIRTHDLKNAAITSGIYAAVVHAQQAHLGGFNLYMAPGAATSDVPASASLHTAPNALTRYEADAEKKRQDIDSQYQEKIEQFEKRKEKLAEEKSKQQSRNTQVQTPTQELEKQIQKLNLEIQGLEKECQVSKSQVDQEVKDFIHNTQQEHAKTHHASQHVFRSFGSTHGYKSLISFVNWVRSAPDAYAHLDQLVVAHPQAALQAVNLFWGTMEAYETDNPLASDLKKFLRAYHSFEEQLDQMIQSPSASDEPGSPMLLVRDTAEIAEIPALTQALADSAKLTSTSEGTSPKTQSLKKSKKKKKR